MNLIKKIKQKKLFIFDLDGTLVDSIDTWNEIDRSSIKKAGDTPRQTLGIEKKTFFNTCTESDIYGKYERYLYDSYELNCDIEEFCEYRKYFTLLYLSQNVSLINGADKMLNFLKQNNYMLALATSSGRLAYDTYITKNKNILSLINFDDYFASNVFTKEDVKNTKPSPDVYLKLKAKFKLKRSDIIIIEDSKAGVIAANSAGIECICIREFHSICDEDFLKKNSILYINSYDEFMGLLEF